MENNTNEAMVDTVEVETNLQEVLKEIDADLAHADRDIEAGKKTVEIAEAFKRLKENADYQLVIEGKYIDGENERVTELLTLPAHLKDEQVDKLVPILGHIRYFGAFTKFLIEDGVTAQENIDKLEDTKDQIKDYRKTVTAEAGAN